MSVTYGSIQNSDTQEFVGLSNQGATCYMNSLLQTLFMTPEFRRELYRWVYDPEVHGAAEDCIPLQLQLLFGKLQLSESSCLETRALTKSFQWDAYDSFEQHDVQEFCRVLFDAIEQSVEKTVQREVIKELYEGTYVDYVKCMQCLHERSREDKFLDINLTVRSEATNYHSLEQAIKAFITPEDLTESNQYFCERCESKQDALKGLKFKTLPYVLVVQLNRFCLDYDIMQRVKLSHRITFPEILNMNPYVLGSPEFNEILETSPEPTLFEITPFTPPEGVDLHTRKVIGYFRILDDEDKAALKPDPPAKKLQRQREAARRAAQNRALLDRYRQDGDNVYELFSVLIHSGSALGGHYYAYIKNFETHRWYDFDDSSVKPINEKTLEKAYGGESNTGYRYWSSHSSTAYLLVYRRVEEARNLTSVPNQEVPLHVVELLEQEQERERKKDQERQEKAKYVKVKVFYQNKDLLLKIMPEGKVQILLEQAVKAFGITEHQIENMRIRGYSAFFNLFQDVFDLDKTLEEQDVYWTRTFAIEVKAPTAEWQAYDPNKVSVKVYMWQDLEGDNVFEQMTATPTVLQLERSSTVQGLMNILAEKFAIPADEQKVIKKSPLYGAAPEVVSSSFNLRQPLYYAKINEGTELFLERKDGLASKWSELLAKEANKLNIRFNHPDAQPNYYGHYEYPHFVLIDSAKSLEFLKQAIANKLNADPNTFILKKGHKHGFELKDLSLTVKQYFSSSSIIFVEWGEPLLPHHIRVCVYLARASSEDAADGVMCAFEELSVHTLHVHTTVEALKTSLLPKLQGEFPEATVRRLRLRDKFSERLGRALLDRESFSVFQAYDKKSVAVQVLSSDDEAVTSHSLLLEARRWHPSTWELSPFVELVVSRQCKVHDFGELLSSAFGIPHENLRVCRVRFASTFMRSELDHERFEKTCGEHSYLGGYLWNINTDGELFIVKDKTEAKRAMTAQERKKYALKTTYRSVQHDFAHEKAVKITVKNKVSDS